MDYVVIGHISQDLQQDGTHVLGGTAAFSGAMARSMGMRVGIVTSVGKECDLSPLDGMSIACKRSVANTVFENRYDQTGRVQYLHHRADDLNLSEVPVSWRSSQIVHLGPIAKEVNHDIVDDFPGAFIGITPQGWLRTWDESGRVYCTDWPEYLHVLRKVDATVLSIDDVGGDWDCLERWAEHTRVLVVTQASEGATVMANGNMRRFPAHSIEEVDSTGAGDLFATAFFIRYHQTLDPWVSCRDAVRLASVSVGRTGMFSLPSALEIRAALDE